MPRVSTALFSSRVIRFSKSAARNSAGRFGFAVGRLNLLKEKTGKKQTEKREPGQMFQKIYPSLLFVPA